jgi:hypothetical protein
VKEHLGWKNIVIEGDLQFVFLSMKRDSLARQQRLTIVRSKYSSSDVLTKIAQVRSAQRTVATVPGYDNEFFVMIGLKEGTRLVGGLTQASSEQLESQFCLAPELNRAIAVQPHRCFDRRAACYLDAGLRLFKTIDSGCEKRCPGLLAPPSIMLR